ncbi:Zn(II)2Cys6 transcription factor [Aspergillus clavatus NRRL 1]|uniref:Sexual development transcription factor RosA n=1 Tax=Aspergillus clavatus (strain ATCC 1007 / CBS 513.65 / DSM 816 / NCTC 3887 / NRRL 1 / QM 1276 / 107) TaxID=344612 RepID=A1CE90_ASPCL|nr:sexual development transcription factor RosA [Aspergillus clavatus NRRL 1]EAW11189.1 sexual development transcription factor RosA [Aspergillus clavatus NRRL 1]
MSTSTAVPLTQSSEITRSNSISSNEAPDAESKGKSNGKFFRRSRSGCYTCRLRRKKCDEDHPACRNCTNLSLSCEYKRPDWWSSAEQRRIQKDRIKTRIRQTKVLEKEKNLQGEYFMHQHLPPRVTAGYDFSQPVLVDPYQSYMPTTAQLSLPTLMPGADAYNPYEIDFGSEPKTMMNGMPMQGQWGTQQPTVSSNPHTYNWPQEGFQRPQNYFYHNAAPPVVEYRNRPLSTYLRNSHMVSEQDRALLVHFVDDVLRLIFPVLDLHQQGPARARTILNSLETNQSYYHCCLSVAAIHLKACKGLRGDKVDHDIMRHRYEAVSQLCKALNNDDGHEQILDATLAMIFFHGSVGASDDYLPDIPWNEHFQAGSNIINKLDLADTGPFVNPPFSMSLASWIDILGATMLRTTPHFSHTYRTKHLSGTSSGLREMMGCDDRIMYLISEIACLDSLIADGLIDDMSIRHHVSALGAQLDYTEPLDPGLENPYSSSGVINVEIFTKNMSSIFRIAARIYLYSLLPEFDRTQISTISLVTAVAEVLRFIPTGPYGFDRSLVWPLLIAGAFSTPSSSFRTTLAQRAEAMGELGDFGNFGRMYRLLQEVWKIADDPVKPSFAESNILLTSPNLRYEISPGHSPCIETFGRSIKKQKVHWRDVMNRKGWRYLLI